MPLTPKAHYEHFIEKNSLPGNQKKQFEKSSVSQCRSLYRKRIDSLHMYRLQATLKYSTSRRKPLPFSKKPTLATFRSKSTKLDQTNAHCALLSTYIFHATCYRRRELNWCWTQIKEWRGLLH